MSDQNWRTEVDAVDFFTHQKKRIALEQRRPVVSRPSDLVGPGIGESAIRITDYNDVLATFNGYYSSDTDALNAPVTDEPLVMTVVSDATLGGYQDATGLMTGYVFRRTFVRRVGDPSAISWGEWKFTERVPASATLALAVPTTHISSAGPILLKPPTLRTIGRADSYSTGSEDIFVLRSGVYNGYLRVSGPAGVPITVTATWPSESASKATTVSVEDAANGPMIPFTFWSTGESQEFRVHASHGEPSDQTITWSDFAITRVGDID